MHIGYHLMAWRRDRGMTQSLLARNANLSRPYLSKLEKGKADPALSCLRQLALALGIKVGQLIEELPQEHLLSREEIDQLARGALRPGTRDARAQKGTRVLALMNKERRKALGFFIPKKTATPKATTHSAAVNSARWMRASLGEKQWNALLRRIDKLAATARPQS
jgi:transcriptional regulator with XRE-family HTH domain